MTISVSEVVWGFVAVIALFANAVAWWDANADLQAGISAGTNGIKERVNRASRRNAFLLTLVQAVMLSIVVAQMFAPEPVRPAVTFYFLYSSTALGFVEIILAFNGVAAMLSRRATLLYIYTKAHPQPTINDGGQA